MAEMKRKPSKFKRFIEKYGAFLTALICLYCVFLNWGSNWFLTAFFGLGVLLCSAIGLLEVSRRR